MQKKKSSNAINSYIEKLLFFIIWPFGAWLYSLKTANSKSSYMIYVLFGLLLCWSMYYDNEKAYLDFIDYANGFYLQTHVSFAEMIEHVKDILVGETSEKDIYRYIVVWLSQTISNNFHVMFVLASIPFMYFMLKCVKLITNDNEAFRNSFICLVLLFLFIYHRDIIRVQNFRFATANWVFVYSFLMTFYKSKKYVFLSLLCPLIHASFLIFCIIHFLYVFLLVHFKYTIKGIFLFTIPFAFFASDFLLQMNLNLSFLPESLSRWAENYMSEETNNAWGTNNNYTGSGFYFVGIFFFLLQRICFIMVPLLIFKNERKGYFTDSEKKILYGYVLLFAITNIFQSFPVIGSRFWSVVAILTGFMLIKYLYKHNLYRKFTYIYIFSFTLNIFLVYIPKIYLALLPIDFYFNNAITLILRHIGVTNYM